MSGPFGLGRVSIECSSSVHLRVQCHSMDMQQILSGHCTNTQHSVGLMGFCNRYLQMTCEAVFWFGDKYFKTCFCDMGFIIQVSDQLSFLPPFYFLVEIANAIQMLCRCFVGCMQNARWVGSYNNTNLGFFLNIWDTYCTVFVTTVISKSGLLTLGEMQSGCNIDRILAPCNNCHHP